MSKPAKTWRVLNLELALDEDESVLRSRAAAVAGVELDHVRGFRLARKSLDARRKGGGRRLRFVVHADLILDADHGGDRLQQAVRSGRIVEAPVSLVDVTPTLAELLELAPPEEAAARFEGRSLAPYLRGETLPERPVFAECGRSYFPKMIEGRVGFDVAGRFRAVVDGDWKLIWTPGQTPEREHQLYDIAADPNETLDRSREFPDRVRALRRMLDGWMAADTRPPAQPIPEADEEALRELGYIDD